MGSSSAHKTVFQHTSSSHGSSTSRDVEAVAPGPHKRSAFLFGGKAFVIGPRVVPLSDELKNDPIYQGDESGGAILEKQLAAEKDQDIQYRTCSWQKAAALLFSEYISLAVMSFPLAYAVLGLVPGLLLTVVIAAITLYTSLVLWEFCLRHPEVRDVCDIGQMIFWGKEWAWWVTTVMFILNNTFVQGIHVLVGAQYLNTMTANVHIGGCKSVQFALVITIAGWMISLPRPVSLLSKLALVSAVCTFVSLVLATVFASIQGKPEGYDPIGIGEPLVVAWPVHGTTFVQAMSALLTMSFTFFGQITLPSFLAEMRDPREFPKSLWACTIAETITFGVVGAVIYVFTGNQYVKSPAVSSLHDMYKKISFSFLLPTILFLGCLYASVTTRFLFFRLFRDSVHTNSHTLKGWASWAGLLFSLWGSAFLISQVIPFFSSLLSVISAIFNSWFGLIFWGLAFFRMRHADRDAGKFDGALSDRMLKSVNVFIICTGFFYFGAGTYSSVQGILDSFAEGSVRGVFQCRGDGL